LIQVVINLLSNAVKFCEPGTGRVAVRLAARPYQARVEVADNGPGIPPDEQEMIFEKFHQLKGLHDEKPRGSGLGLTISQRIIAHHGGRIWVESEPGAGARFIFEIPLAQVEKGGAKTLNPRVSKSVGRVSGALCSVPP
jgi:signal transduction histidine kinase